MQQRAIALAGEQEALAAPHRQEEVHTEKYCRLSTSSAYSNKVERSIAVTVVPGGRATSRAAKAAYACADGCTASGIAGGTADHGAGSRAPGRTDECAAGDIAVRFWRIGIAGRGISITGRVLREGSTTERHYRQDSNRDRKGTIQPL
jgi:hypothetical protein